MRKRNFSSGISKELKTNRAVTLAYEKGCQRDVRVQPLRSGGSEKPIRFTNDVDLLSFGSAQLVIVARLSAWRSVRAEASFQEASTLPLSVGASPVVEWRGHGC